MRICSKNVSALDENINIRPTETLCIELPEWFDAENYKVELDGDCIVDTGLTSAELSRPEASPKDFDYNSVYGLYLQGREFHQQNYKDKAIGFYVKSLEKDPYFSPSLNALSEIYYSRNMLTEAKDLALRALSINTYDYKANMNFARVSARQKFWADALDGYSVAMQSDVYCGVAAVEAGIIYYRNGNISSAKRVLQKGIESSRNNYRAKVLLAIIYRLQGERNKAVELLESVLSEDKLNYHARYEMMLNTGDNKALKFKSEIINEYSKRTFIDLSMVYYSLGLYQEAINVFEGVAVCPEILYMKSMLTHITGDDDAADRYITQAEELSPSGVFPNNVVDEDILKWVLQTGKSQWKASYYLAILYLHFGRIEEACMLLEDLGNKPDFYGFYLTRAKNTDINKYEDYMKAIELSPENYVCYLEAGKYFMNIDDCTSAVKILKKYYSHNTSNSYINLLLAKAYMADKSYLKAVKLLNKFEVLPNEGSLDGRNTWRECNLNFAAELIRKGDLKSSLKYIDNARIWPENLGVGKPYDNMVDERLENLLEWFVKKKLGKHDNDLLKKVGMINESFNKEGAMNAFSRLVCKRIKDESLKESCTKLSDNENCSSVAFRWADAVCSGDYGKAKTIKNEPYTLPEALPFEIPFEDRDFVFIKNNYDIIEMILEFLTDKCSVE